MSSVQKTVCFVQDMWVEADSYSCLKRCACPPDGAACALDPGCDAHHFACKPGFQRFSDGKPKCFKPGCAAGSLHEAAGRSVSNGRAYAVCTCTGALWIYKGSFECL